LVEFDLAPGDYYVEVQEYYNDKEIAAYYLSVNAFSLDDAYEFDGDYLHSSDLVPGEEQTHSIGAAGQDVDWFQFELYSDSDVYIETSGLEGDTVMSLYSADSMPGPALETDDDSGEGYFSLLELSGLAQGQYYIDVEAYEGFYGFEPISEYSIVILTDPSAPVDLTVQMSGTVVQLEWSAPLSDGGRPIDHYQILRAISGGVPSAFRGVLGTSFIDMNVSAGEGYVYAVSAVTEFGSGHATNETQILVPIGLGTPSAIGALSVDEADDAISLSWTQPDANGTVIVAYHVYRGTKSDASDRIEIGQSTGPGYIDSTVEKGEEYYYWVVAENGNGMGAISAPIAATATSVGGLGGMLWPMILVALVVIGVVVVLVLVLGKRSDARSQSGNRFPPTTQPGSLPQTASGRCPSCGASIEGMQFCGNCGRRLP
jgi:hypothetical protein